MAALLTSVTEAVRVGGLSGCQVSGSFEGVTMVSDPSGLLHTVIRCWSVLVVLVVLWVVEIGVCDEVMSLAHRLVVIHDLRLGQVGVEQRDFTVVRLKEDGVFEVRSHVHRCLIVEHRVAATRAWRVRALVSLPSKRNAIVLVRLLRTLLASSRSLIKVLFFTICHDPIQLFIVIGRCVGRIVINVIAVCHIVENASLIGVHRILIFIVSVNQLMRTIVVVFATVMIISILLAAL